MFIYDDSTFQFVDHATDLLKRIILNETPFKLRRSRFEYNGYLYPISLVIFEGKGKVAYFDASSFQIGLNYELIHKAPDSSLKLILRHELAHYLTFLFYGADIESSHGKEFKQICSLYNWGDDVIKASYTIEASEVSQTSKIVEKVKKLLKLAKSSNAHESQMATLKANQLLIKHNIKNINNAGDKIFMQRLLESPRRNQKLITIYDILKNFMVKPVISYGHKRTWIEVTGSKENIELASYIAHYLNQELDRLWLKYKEENQLKGLRAKNSFFMGLAKGYEQKVQASLKEMTSDDAKALVLIDKKLEQSINRIYKRFSRASHKGSLEQDSFKLGTKAGSHLNINPAIKNTKNILELT